MLPRPNSSTEAHIADPETYFHDLGNLHDSKLVVIELDLAKRAVVFVVDDLYANFRGLPEYVGSQPVRLTLNDVDVIDLGITFDRLPMRVMDFEVKTVSYGPRIQAVMKIQPSGSISASCGSIACRPT
jgi:hypothetical protein